MKISFRMAALAAGTVIALSAGVAQAASDDAGKNKQDKKAETAAPAYTAKTVVARVNGREITVGDLEILRATLPQQYQQLPLELLFANLREQAVSRQLVTDAADKSGLRDDQEFKDRLAVAERRILQQIYLTRAIEAAVTDEALKKAYEEAVAKMKPVEEVRARHILVKTEDEAKKIIGELDKGADFAELAKKYSTGPTGKDGGDLGYFTKGDMVAEFSDAAFKLKPGEYTKKPVKSSFGWHVIKLEDRRQKAKPSLDDMRQELTDQLSRQALSDLLADLRGKSKVEVFKLDGTPDTAATGEEKKKQ